MNENLLIDITREAIVAVILVSSPVLLIALLVGLLVSIFQTVTSIQEQTLAFVPKIMAVFVSILIFGPWGMNIMLELINKLFSSFSIMIRG